MNEISSQADVACFAFLHGTSSRGMNTGPTMSTALVHAGLTSLEKIEEINARELEMVLLYYICSNAMNK